MLAENGPKANCELISSGCVRHGECRTRSAKGVCGS